MIAGLRVSIFSLLFLAFVVCAVSNVQASDAAATIASTKLAHSAVQKNSAPLTAIDASADAALSTDMRWHIKRQVMSKSGVLLDMANMTDSGYAWTNDVVWGLPDDKNWYTAGFFFERPGYKGVWLQYAFRLAASTGKIRQFKRWYGVGTFR